MLWQIVNSEQRTICGWIFFFSFCFYFFHLFSSCVLILWRLFLFMLRLFLPIRILMDMFELSALYVCLAPIYYMYNVYLRTNEWTIVVFFLFNKFHSILRALSIEHAAFSNSESILNLVFPLLVSNCHLLPAPFQFNEHQTHNHLFNFEFNINFHNQTSNFRDFFFMFSNVEMLWFFELRGLMCVCVCVFVLVNLYISILWHCCCCWS